VSDLVDPLLSRLWLAAEQQRDRAACDGRDNGERGAKAFCRRYVKLEEAGDPP